MTRKATRPNLTGALLPFLIACAIPYSASDDEVGGDPKPNSEPPEGPNPPEWMCKERLPSTLVVDGKLNYAHELERCPYAPSTSPEDGEGYYDAWPGKPWWDGLPQVNIFSDWPLRQHPMYAWRDPDSVTLKPYHDSIEDYRSGMIGNIGLYTTGIPTIHPRVPIVAINATEMVGHPFYAGRNNMYGQPCSTIEPDVNPNQWTDLLTDVYPHSTNAECQAVVDYYGVRAAHANYPLSASSQINARATATCLDNGGHFEPSQALLSALQRQGLIWLNWDEFQDIQQQVVAELVLLQDLIVWIDLLLDNGWDYWPLDAEWPWSRWSHTGLCGHSVRLLGKQATHQIVTETACPRHMVAVLPTFNVKQVIENEESVFGYCTFPHQTPPPGVGIKPDGSLDEVTTCFGSQCGFQGAKYVWLAAFDEDKIGDWLSAVGFTQTTAGIQVDPANALGREILAKLDVDPGSIILGVNELDFTTGDPDGPSVLDAMLEVERAWLAGGFAFVLLDQPDGMRLHRYIVPVWQTEDYGGTEFDEQTEAIATGD